MALNFPCLVAMILLAAARFSSTRYMTIRCRAFAFSSTPIHSSRTSQTSKTLSVQPFATQLFSSGRDRESVILEGLNDAQVQAVTQPLSSITRVVAGPGAGKTRVLTSRIAYLLHHDDSDRRILAVTFTKKAAGEMQERLEKLVAETTAQDDSPADESTVKRQVSGETEGSILQEEVAGTDSSLRRRSTCLSRVTLGTFHSVCSKILRWNGKHLASLPSVVEEMTGVANSTNLDGSYSIVDQGEQLRLVKECADELGIDLKGQGIKPLTVLNAIGKIKSGRAMGEDPTKSNGGRKVPSKTMRVGAKLYPLYRQKLLTRNALDFDDLILMTRELLMVHDDVREHFRRRWMHVLVDEFQDTSQSQLDLVKLLASDSLLVVGDADQSIYSWRGAHAESMSDFSHHFSDRLDGVNTVHLMENYRSTTNIVSAAQKVISTDNSSSKQADLRKDMKPMRGVGPSPRVLACADAKAEASFVVQTIQDCIESGDYTPESTVAIVYRTNAQSRAIEEACVKASLPYVIRGSSGAFYKRAEIQDCLCFLRLLRNGRDEAAMKRAVKTPSRGIGEKALEEFNAYCQVVDDFYESNYPERQKPTPFDVLISLTDGQSSDEASTLLQDAPSPEFLSKRALNRFIPFSSQMRLIRDKAQTLTVAGLLSSIIVNLQLRSHIDSISKSSSEFADRWSNVIELRRAAQKYSEEGASVKPLQQGDGDEIDRLAETPLGNFLDDVALVTDMADDATDPTRTAEKRLVVNLMTIHASKGMEFDGVFLIGNEDGTLPSKLAILEGEGSVALDEEKRLCYVAMTRAKTHLIMTWRREVSLFTGNTFTTVDASRSRFLDILVGKKGSKKQKKNGGKKDSKGKTQSSTLSSTGERSVVQGRRHESPYSTLPRATMSNNLPRARPTNGRRSRDFSTTRHRPKRRVSEATVASKRKEPYDVRVRASLPAQATPNSRNGVIATKRAAVKNQKSPARPAPGSETSMDSTWFYPIGSSVVHKQYGNGLVLPPPPSTNGSMLVRVQFEDGSKQNFAADGTDLHLY